ncbi:MAG: hypothetical protein ACTH8A_12995 [Serratia proteamaculans]
MLFIAPVISRSLEHARVGQSEPAGMADCGMDMSMHSHRRQSQPARPACRTCQWPCRPAATIWR